MHYPERIVRVNLQNHAYEIVVRPGLIDEAGPRLRALSRAARTIVITDSNIPQATVEAVRNSLATEFEPHVLTVPAGEEHKSVESVMKLFDQILPLKVDRNTPLVALGGGVIGDMTGFVAATLLRGVPFVQMPTTLLSMVDASVGGKTGVNHAVGKNLIGAFHQPIAVLIDPAVLKTLPERELRGGLAECIKHDVIRDAAGFDRLAEQVGRALSLDLGYLTELVTHNVAIKARVVEADPFERGERAHLNFGHTFGHAIENVSHYAYSHGESVALGMAAASHLSRQLGLLTDEQYERVLTVIRRAGLPTSGLKLDVDDVVRAMAFDKKVAAGKIRFVLLDGLGKAVVRNDVPSEMAKAAVESLL